MFELSNGIGYNQVVSAPPGSSYSNSVNSCMKNFMTEQSSFGQHMMGGMSLKKNKKVIYEILKILTKNFAKSKKNNIRQIIKKKLK
jgi:queuine/archaeosine tRNA-ribosyltransferase